MAQNDVFKRYLDAGMAFTQMTRSKAEEIVRDWVKAGEVQRDQIQSQVDELIERSRRSTDQLVVLIRDEVINQCAQLGLVSKDDLRSLQRRLMEQFGVAGRSWPGSRPDEDAGPDHEDPARADERVAPTSGSVTTAVGDSHTVAGTTPAAGTGAPRAKRTARTAASGRKASARTTPAPAPAGPAAASAVPAAPPVAPAAPPAGVAADRPPAKRARKAAPAKKAAAAQKAAPAKRAPAKKAPGRKAGPGPSSSTES